MLSNISPVIKQFEIDQQIAERTIRSALASWLPQISGNYNLQRYLKLPVSLFPNFSNPTSPERIPVTTGVANLSNIQFSLSQNIFNRDVLLASRTADTYRDQARQNLITNKIDVTVNVSKAFYDLILTQKQVDILDGDIVRSGAEFTGCDQPIQKRPGRSHGLQTGGHCPEQFAGATQAGAGTNWREGPTAQAVDGLSGQRRTEAHLRYTATGQ
jgi:hypothetical protein